MKQWIPVSVRRSMRVAQRSLTDLKSGDRSRFVPRGSIDRIKVGQNFSPQIKLQQALKVSAYSENKQQNLEIAAKAINHIAIYPGELFSFWHHIGKPSERRGYLPGRSLVNNVLQAELGGGLCQLSGLLYYLAIKAGLEIVERYPHSMDIYTEETRFTPLGSDATVVYGYKDFRCVNSLSQPICFHVVVQADRVIGQLCAENPTIEHDIEFQPRRSSEREVEIETLRRSPTSSAIESLGTSRYRLLVRSPAQVLS